MERDASIKRQNAAALEYAQAVRQQMDNLLLTQRTVATAEQFGTGLVGLAYTLAQHLNATVDMLVELVGGDLTAESVYGVLRDR